MPPPLDQDVVVVGGGPSGTFFAREAARRGLRVTVLEQARFPRIKVCGGLLAPAVLDLFDTCGLGESFARLPGRTLSTLEWIPATGSPVQASWSGRCPVCVRRDLLDDWLRREAEAAGVRFVESTRPNLLDGATLHAGDDIYRAKFIVGADGRNSWVAREAGLVSGRGREGRVAWHTTLPRCRLDTLRLMCFDFGYGLLAPSGGEEVTAALVLENARHLAPQQVLKDRLPEAGPHVWHSAPSLGHLPAAPARGPVFLLGDALEVGEPLAGTGLWQAFSSAQLLARILAGWPRASSLSHTGLLYAEGWKEIRRRARPRLPIISWLGRHPRIPARMTATQLHHLAPWILPPIWGHLRLG